VVFHFAILVSYDSPAFVALPQTHIVTRTFVEQKPPPVRVIASAPKKKRSTAPKKVAKIKPKVDKNRANNDLEVSIAPDLAKITEPGIQLISFLRRSLRLPTEGAVKVRLTILANGKIEDVEIISTESEQNSHYLVEQMRKLTLPFMGRKSQTLVIAFCNES